MHYMKLPLVVISFFALLLLFITTQYWSFETHVMFLLVKQDLVFDSIWLPVFYVHVFTSSITMLVGPLQFFSKLRNRFPTFHKITGRAYAYSILLFAAPTGLYMAFYSEGGPFASLGFIFMAFGWWWSTYSGVWYAVKRKVTKHREWMIVSFAFSFAAVTLRLLVPLMSIVFDIVDENTITITTAWSSWILNLAVAFGIIYMGRKNVKLKLIAT